MSTTRRKDRLTRAELHEDRLGEMWEWFAPHDLGPIPLADDGTFELLPAPPPPRPGRPFSGSPTELEVRGFPVLQGQREPGGVRVGVSGWYERKARALLGRCSGTTVLGHQCANSSQLNSATCGVH